MKVNHVNLTAFTKPFGDNVVDSRHRLLRLHHGNALRAAIREHLAKLMGYVVMSLLGTLPKSIALAMIDTMNLQKIQEQPLEISWLLEC